MAGYILDPPPHSTPSLVPVLCGTAALSASLLLFAGVTVASTEEAAQEHAFSMDHMLIQIL